MFRNKPFAVSGYVLLGLGIAATGGCLWLWGRGARRPRKRGLAEQGIIG